MRMSVLTLHAGCKEKPENIYSDMRPLSVKKNCHMLKKSAYRENEVCREALFFTLLL